MCNLLKIKIEKLLKIKIKLLNLGGGFASPYGRKGKRKNYSNINQQKFQMSQTLWTGKSLLIIPYYLNNLYKQENDENDICHQPSDFFYLIYE